MAAISADCSKEQEENHALPNTIPLYNDTGDHAHPALTIHYPTNLSSDTRYAALLCCRGGGHATCLGSGEGTAAWAADSGMVGVEVEYRTSLADGGSGFEVDREPAFFPANGFEDLRRAIAVVRAVLHNVVDADRIGLVGFSAGGHLAALVATRPGWSFAGDTGDDADAAEDADERRTSAPTVSAPAVSRLVLCYPVISLEEGKGATFTAINFLGKPGELSSVQGGGQGDDSAAAVVGGCAGAAVAAVATGATVPAVPAVPATASATELRFATSPDRHVSPATCPPTFIWTTADDPVVPMEHSLMFFRACREAKVPVELHVYDDAGGHAQGLAGDNPRVKGWTDQLLAWLGDWAVPL
jgi:acetyl esterase/lipase